VNSTSNDTTSVTAVSSESFGLKKYFLLQNYPDSSNPSSTISYELPQTEFFTVKIIDAISNEIETVVKEIKQAGVHKVNFDASHLSSGKYLYKIDAGRFYQSKKMLLVK